MRHFVVWVIAAGLLLVAVSLRTWRFTSEPPDYFTVSADMFLRMSPGEYLTTDRDIDQCPPLFYALYRLAVVVDGPSWLPLVTSIALGALAPVLLFLSLRRPYGMRTAATAGLLLAVNPWHVVLSQALLPAALGIVLVCALLYYLFRSAENPRPGNWIPYTVLLTLLLYSHPGAPHLAFVLLLVHLAAVFLFRDRQEQRRVRVSRRLAQVWGYYALAVLAALPWIVRMDGRVPWHVPYTELEEALKPFVTGLFFGPARDLHGAWRAGQIVLVAAVIPPLIKSVRSGRFNDFVPLFSLLVAFLVLYGYGQMERMRLLPERDAVLLLPLFVLLIANLASHCNRYVAGALTTVFVVLFAAATARQSTTRHNLDWYAMAAAIESGAKNTDSIVFWPDFTVRFGQYLFGNRLPVAPAGEVMKKWAETPPEHGATFVITQYPLKSDHLYTFPGALRHFATSRTLWSSGRNTVIQAENIDWRSLKMWYDDPDTLNILDQPTSDTMFLFTADNRVYRDDQQFYFDDPALCYDPDGRRVVWMRGERADLRLPVTLTPGSYVLRLHCSPILDLPEFDPPASRKVTVKLRSGEERTQMVVDSETTLRLPFTFDVEARSLPVHIEVEPLLRTRRPIRLSLGLKIYSIAIDQELPAGEPVF
jgi:hypothetical protein